MPAWNDISNLQTSVTFGLLVRNMHRWGAHLMVLSVFLHMARVFYHGAYKPPREFNWVIGVMLLMLTLLLSFTGYLLPWDQLALWAVTVGTNMMGYTPVFGTQVRFVLLGGKEIGSRDAAAVVRAARAVAAVRHRHLHGDPLLACPQGRRHLGAAVSVSVRRSMTEIPEHLLKRAQAAREKAAAEAGAGRPLPRRRRRGRRRREPAADPRIPAHLLERSKAAKAQGRGVDEAPAAVGGGAVARRRSPASSPPRPPAAACRSAPGPAATPSAC